MLQGFFRRSIQQKIQYKPCTKNQQCSILRINRNRCQYCRLKKCIAVGMSRDGMHWSYFNIVCPVLCKSDQSTQSTVSIFITSIFSQNLMDGWTFIRFHEPVFRWRNSLFYFMLELFILFSIKKIRSRESYILTIWLKLVIWSYNKTYYDSFTYNSKCAFTFVFYITVWIIWYPESPVWMAIVLNLDSVYID